MNEFAEQLALIDVPVRRLAAQLGVSPASVSRYLSGQQIPLDRQVPVLARIMDISESDLRTMLSEARAAKQEERVWIQQARKEALRLAQAGYRGKRAQAPTSN